MGYIRQPNYYTCGPTALYNLLTYCNAHCRELSFRKLIELCKCDSIMGTRSVDFQVALKKVCAHAGVSYASITECTVDQIIQKLRAGFPVILEYHWKINELGLKDEHYVLLTGNWRGTSVEIINNNGDGAVGEWISYRELEELLIPYRYPLNGRYENIEDRAYPKGWYIFPHST